MTWPARRSLFPQLLTVLGEMSMTKERKTLRTLLNSHPHKRHAGEHCKGLGSTPTGFLDCPQFMAMIKSGDINRWKLRETTHCAIHNPTGSAVRSARKRTCSRAARRSVLVTAYITLKNFAGRKKKAEIMSASLRRLNHVLHGRSWLSDQASGPRRAVERARVGGRFFRHGQHDAHQHPVSSARRSVISSRGRRCVDQVSTNTDQADSIGRQCADQVSTGYRVYPAYSRNAGAY